MKTQPPRVMSSLYFPIRVDMYAQRTERQTTMATDTQINFGAPATLRKWPSIKSERVSAALGARPYMIIEGTLDNCIREFMAKPMNQHHLYEIHTSSQGDLITAVLSADQIGELARLRDFL